MLAGARLIAVQAPRRGVVAAAPHRRPTCPWAVTRTSSTDAAAGAATAAKAPIAKTLPGQRPAPAPSRPAVAPPGRGGTSSAPAAGGPGHDDDVGAAAGGRVGVPPRTDSPAPPSPSSVDWIVSFFGVSARPVSEEQMLILTRPIPQADIEVKNDGIIYLPEIKYRRRLNEAFGPMGWGIIPRLPAVVGDTMVTREYALIVQGRFVSQALGENTFFGREQVPSSIEGCKSNALMRCCKDLCIASELWDPHFIRWFKKTHMEQVWVEHTTTKKRRTMWFRKGGFEVAYPYKLSDKYSSAL